MSLNRLICVLCFLHVSIYILRYRIPRLFYLRTEKKKVLTVVGIILSQLYNELLSPGNSLPWERNSKCNGLLLSLILISIMWYYFYQCTPWILRISTVILWAFHLFFFIWLCGHIWPYKNVFQLSVFLSLLSCFDYMFWFMDFIYSWFQFSLFCST